MHNFTFNWAGCWALFKKEVKRFYSVAIQTIFAPIVSTLLYLLIFGQVIDTQLNPFQGVGYSEFLIPGLVMMALMQNAFSNSSSSLIQAKMHGNFTFVLLSPLSSLEIYLAFTAASVVRGLVVGLGVLAVGVMGYHLALLMPGWVFLFAVLSAAVLGSFGLMAGILSTKYDHLAAFQNFVIMPLTFLSGVFYSIRDLPPFWQHFSHLNPFFYMVDGFRYGFFQQSDVNPWLSLGITVGFLLLLTGINLILLKKGVKIRY